MTETPRQTEVKGWGRKRSYLCKYEKIWSKKWKWIISHSVWFAWNSVDLRKKYTIRTQDRQKLTFLLLSKYYSFHDVRTYVWGRQHGREYIILEFSPKLSTYTLVHLIRPDLYCACSGLRIKSQRFNLHFYSLKNKFSFTREFSIQ